MLFRWTDGKGPPLQFDLTVAMFSLSSYNTTTSNIKGKSNKSDCSPVYIPLKDRFVMYYKIVGDCDTTTFVQQIRDTLAGAVISKAWPCWLDRIRSWWKLQWLCSFGHRQLRWRKSCSIPMCIWWTGLRRPSSLCKNRALIKRVGYRWKFHIKPWD